MKKVLVVLVVGLFTGLAHAEHFTSSDTNIYARTLKNTLLNSENSLNTLNGILGTMTQMINGDGSQDAHYAKITGIYGFADDAASHAAFNELASVLGKLNTDSSVSNVNAALKQAFNKFR